MSTTTTRTTTRTTNAVVDLEDIIGALTDWNVIVAAALNKRATRNAVLRAFKNPDLEGRMKVARHVIERKTRDGHILARIAADPAREVRTLVAEFTGTPFDLLERLSADRSAMVRAAVASNQQSPAVLLDRLSIDKRVVVRMAVAGRMATESVSTTNRHGKAIRACSGYPLTDDMSRRILDRLVADPSPSVRLILACKHLPAEYAITLAADPNPYVAKAMAGNRSAPSDALAISARHPDRQTRQCAVANPATADETIAQMVDDLSVAVRRDVALRTTDADVLITLGRDRSTEVRSAVLLNPTASPAVLTQVEVSRSMWLQLQLIKHPNTTPDLLRPILISPWPRSRHAARERLCTSFTVYPPRPYETMAASGHYPAMSDVDRGDVDDLIQIYWLLDHYSATDNLFEAALSDRIPLRIRLEILALPNVPDRILSALARDPDRWIRAAVAESRCLPAELAEALSTDRSGWVRYYLAENTRCPLPVLEHLRSDRDRDIAAAARRTIESLTSGDAAR